jgi:hypothetical protein
MISAPVRAWIARIDVSALEIVAVEKMPALSWTTRAGSGEGYGGPTVGEVGDGSPVGRALGDGVGIGDGCGVVIGDGVALGPAVGADVGASVTGVVG